MTWEQYNKERLTCIREGKAAKPKRRDIIKMSMISGRVYSKDEIVFELCRRTGIDRNSADQNIDSSLEKLIDKGVLVCVTPGFYRKL